MVLLQESCSCYLLDKVFRSCSWWQGEQARCLESSHPFRPAHPAFSPQVVLIKVPGEEWLSGVNGSQLQVGGLIARGKEQAPHP